MGVSTTWNYKAPMILPCPGACWSSGLLCQYYGQPPLQQVLYVGEALLTMPARLEYPTLAFQYEPIDIRTLDGATLLTSPSLEDNLLALLCRLQNPRGAVQHLLARIASLVGTARTDALAKLVIPGRTQAPPPSCTRGDATDAHHH